MSWNKCLKCLNKWTSVSRTSISTEYFHKFTVLHIWNVISNIYHCQSTKGLCTADLILGMPSSSFHPLFIYAALCNRRTSWSKFYLIFLNRNIVLGLIQKRVNLLITKFFQPNEKLKQRSKQPEFWKFLKHFWTY